jgi:hypothetical protein
MKMRINQITSVFIILLFCGCFLFSQNLVDLAKKEKERRERLKGTPSVVLTNLDLKRVSREETTASAQLKSPPQKSTETVPVPKAPARKTPLAEQVENLDQADQIDTASFTLNYATRILESTQFVENAQFALNKPDGQFAKIPILGILDLEISAKNGPGADIIIYAKQAGAKEIMPGGEEEIGTPFEAFMYDYWQGFWYGVLGMEEQGDWIAIGTGTGMTNQEEFDIGDLRSIKRVRIIFKPHNNADPGVKFYRMQPGESLFGIDAVEALHQ